jgi:S-DNA-T family DNA segregation ATPase FtsK/SpoIIIE
MAGTTGSGKSTCLHSVLLSVLMRATPEQVRMLLIDTHSLELGRYQGVAHLVAPVATKTDRAAQALAWAVHEAQARLDDLSAVRKRHIEDFNTAVRSGTLRTPPGAGSSRLRPYPLLLIAIDDLADLLRSPQRDQIQDSLLQLGTRGRMAGIHLIAATRHPQAHALPGRLSATMPARLSFLATEGPGPTRTLRIGTAELTAPGKPPTGIWCTNITEREINAVTSHWRTAPQHAPAQTQGGP